MSPRQGTTLPHGMPQPIIREYTQRIEAEPAVVFPLICPVREAEWLEGWAEAFELIWSASGAAEPGCVFRTREVAVPETIWVIADHDPTCGRVRFVRVTEGLLATTLDIVVSDVGDGASSVQIRYTTVPTSGEGARFAANRFDPGAFSAEMAWWERSMNHYLRTGALLHRLQVAQR